MIYVFKTIKVLKFQYIYIYILFNILNTVNLKRDILQLVTNCLTIPLFFNFKIK